jgi:hypothetical protein
MSDDYAHGGPGGPRLAPAISGGRSERGGTVGTDALMAH